MSDERPKVDHDTPPFSRVFVVCSKSHTDEEIKDAFEVYGEIEDVWVVKRKDTKESKGIAYVKFAKASEAAQAIEKLHGKHVGDNPKPIKALLADSKSQRERSDPVTQLALTEDKHRTRIFILVPKTMTDSELNIEFSQYGKVDHVQILKDRTTMESKGCAYVRFSKPSEAFFALENCGKTFKAVIAEPRVPKNIITNTQDNHFGGHGGNHVPSAQQVICPVPAGYPDMTEHGASNKLTITCHTSITETQLTRLLDVCPGFEGVQFSTTRHGESKGLALVSYSNPTTASYAKYKLNNVEYPPGYRVSANFNKQDQRGHYQQQSNMDPYGNQGQGYNMNMGYTGYDQSMGTGYDYYNMAGAAAQPQPPAAASSCPYTDVALPGHQHMSPTAACRAKLFFVAAPNPVTEEVMTDVFCRFSDLIDIQIIQGTAYGYIRYGMKESADAAKMLLDGATIAGSTMRLSFADSNGDNSKRTKVDHLH